MSDQVFEMTEVAQDAYDAYVSQPVNFDTDNSDVIERDAFIAGWDSSVENLYKVLTSDSDISDEVSAKIVQILAESRAEIEIS